ncbi:MAG: diaminopimelate decarboxylase [Archangium sp.]|nr:diaminopimelate decarboxylase [Archangium sp.]
MNHFDSRNGALCAEDVPLEKIAHEVGTPTYVYSSATLNRHLSVVRDAFGTVPHVLCYSVKANSTLGVLKLVVKHGSGFDIVSGGELARVLEAGGDPKRIVFSGVGKREDEMVAALRAGILMFNVESAEELALLDRVGRRAKKKAPFSLRVNPDVDPRTHKYIATGLKSSKFGVPFEEAVALYRASRKMKGLQAMGVDCHIGSQLTDAKPFAQALSRVAGLYTTLKAEGFPLTHLDVGGGLGVTYTDEKPPGLAAYSQVVVDSTRHTGATVVLEPGRVIVANAGVLITRVLFNKKTKTKHFLIVDAGMNDLMRPALYEAHHDIVAVKPRRGAKTTVEIVGPVCESTDVLGKARSVPPLVAGDLLAIKTAGAYGMSMASTYNSRPRPAEVLVDGKRWRVIRKREALQDLWRGETP